MSTRRADLFSDEASRKLGLPTRAERIAPKLAEALRDCITEDGATCFAHEALLIRRLRAINEVARAALAEYDNA